MFLHCLSHLCVLVQAQPPAKLHRSEAETVVPASSLGAAVSGTSSYIAPHVSGETAAELSAIISFSASQQAPAHAQAQAAPSEASGLLRQEDIGGDYEGFDSFI